MGMNYRLLSANLETMSNKLFELRHQAATGKKLNRPSDSPSAIRPVLNYRIQHQSTDRYLNHLSSAQGEIRILDSHLGNIENIMVAAKETAIAAANSGANDADRQTYADKIHQLYEELLYAGNTQVNGKYLFSGYSEDTPPFNEQTFSVEGTATFEQTDSGAGGGLTGYTVFFSADEEDYVDGGTLQVVINGHIIEADMAEDNVDESINRLIDAINDTTATGSGHALEGVLTEIETVEDFSGVIHLTAANRVGYQGDNNIKTVEIEPGKSIDKQVSGSALFLGEPGGENLFSVLKNLEETIRGGDIQAINERLDQLEDSAEQVRRARGRMGNNAWRIDRASAYLADAAIEFESMISRYEDADALDVFSKILAHEFAFEAALNVTTRVSRMSILDFM